MRPHSIFELLLLSFFWGSSFLLIQIGVAEFGPPALIFLRTMLAGLVLVLILIFRNEVRLLVHHWKNFLPLGLLDSTLPYLLSAYAALHIPSGTISVINAVTPLWGALVAWLWLGIHLTLTSAMGLLIGLLGITFLVWDRFELALSDSTFALIAAVCGPVCYALSACYAKKYLSGFSPFVNATGSSLTSGVLLLPLAWYWWPTETCQRDRLERRDYLTASTASASAPLRWWPMSMADPYVGWTTRSVSTITPTISERPE